MYLFNKSLIIYSITFTGHNTVKIIAKNLCFFTLCLICISNNSNATFLSNTLVKLIYTGAWIGISSITFSKCYSSTEYSGRQTSASSASVSSKAISDANKGRNTVIKKQAALKIHQEALTIHLQPKNKI